jgi:hypothetical protein
MDRQHQGELVEAQAEILESAEAAFRFLTDTQLVLVGGGIGDTVL